MTKILLTGGMGYIGSHATVELLNLGYKIEILDNLFNSKIEVLNKIEKITGERPVFHKVDLLDYEGLEKVVSEGNFDAVIHFAGLKAVGESVEKPLWYYENNITGTINLLKVMNKYGVKKIIFSSSATVYGDQGISKFSEDMTTGINITNPYGQTKYMIEQILKDEANADKKLQVSILRYFNPVGAHESGFLGEDPNDIPNNLMPIIMKVAKKEIEFLRVFGSDYNTPDGTGVRDYIHVVDLVKGHIKALEKIKPGINIYNLGTGSGTSVLEMIKAFEEASGESLPYKIEGRRAGDLAEMCAIVDKAKTELEWEAKKTIDDAMRDTLRFLRNN